MKKKVTSPKINKVEDRLFGIETRLTRLEKSMVRLEDRIEKFHEKLFAEFFEFRSKIYTLLDPISGQLKKFNEEQVIHAGQHQEVYEKVEKLEEIHPKFTHAAI